MVCRMQCCLCSESPANRGLCIYESKLLTHIHVNTVDQNEGNGIEFTVDNDDVEFDTENPGSHTSFVSVKRRNFFLAAITMKNYHELFSAS